MCIRDRASPAAASFSGSVSVTTAMSGSAMRKDFTSFYAANEAVAVALRRLLDAGALDEVVEALRRTGARLELEVYDPALQQAEYLGQIEPGEGEGEERYEYEDFLAERKEQWVRFGDGVKERVYMPDHVCPTCGHEDDNFIDETLKTCAACRFQW